MNEIFDKLMESGKKDAFSSAEKFRAAAAELGYGQEAIEAAIAELDIPLDVEALDVVSGGVNFFTYKKGKDRDEPNGRIFD